MLVSLREGVIRLLSKGGAYVRKRLGNKSEGV